jgi:hypothetical protein
MMRQSAAPIPAKVPQTELILLATKDELARVAART